MIRHIGYWVDSALVDELLGAVEPDTEGLVDDEGIYEASLGVAGGCHGSAPVI
jgi:hypothetical protein